MAKRLGNRSQKKRGFSAIHGIGNIQEAAAAREQAARAARSGDGRATGWRVPLLFCAAIILITAIAWVIKDQNQEKLVAIAPDLEAIAGSWNIDLEGDAWAREAKKEMSTLATGFKNADTKDTKIATLGRGALAIDRLDVACAASLFMHRDRIRGDYLKEIYRKATQDCSTMPWAVFAVRNIVETPDGNSAAIRLARDLNTRWQACGRSLGPRYREGERLPGTGYGDMPAQEGAAEEAAGTEAGADVAKP